MVMARARRYSDRYTGGTPIVVLPFQGDINAEAGVRCHSVESIVMISGHLARLTGRSIGSFMMARLIKTWPPMQLLL